MPMTLAQLAELVGGAVVGDGSLEIAGAATLLDATGADITLADKPEKAPALAASAARAAVVPPSFPIEALTLPAIVVDDVHRAFTLIVTHFRPPRAKRRIGISVGAIISNSARVAHHVDIHPGATIGDDVEIGPGSIIHSGARVMAGCKLANDVVVYPNAVLYEGTIVGPRSAIHSGAVIGCHGFGYRVFEGNNQPCAQVGWVEIGADCEIGACTTIDRGTYGPTTIGDDTKIDNQVMIAHNCRIGKHNMICSQVGVAGSTTTGEYVVIAGQVGVRDHVKIGDRAILGAQAGVSSDVPAGAHMLGSPAIREREQKIQFAAMSKLPEMRRQLRKLERTVEEMSRNLPERPSSNQAA